MNKQRKKKFRAWYRNGDVVKGTSWNEPWVMRNKSDVLFVARYVKDAFACKGKLPKLLK